MSEKKEYRILVIDDDEEDFFIIKDLCSDIKSSRVEVHWISTYDEGVKAVIDCTYDLFFVDYLLGGKSGLEVVEHAVANQCPAPLVLLTGFADDDLDKRALRAGATDYLAKGDLSVAMLERTIRHSVERFKQLQLFHQQEAKFHGFFEQSLDGIFLVDSDWKLIDVNVAMIEMFDLNSTDMSQNLKKIIFPEIDLPRFESLLDEAGQVTNYPVTLKRQGKNVDLLVSCLVVRDIVKKNVGYQGVVRDITAFKRAEQELARAEQFTLSGRMARILAHEVRNPLSNISLAAGYLDEFEGLDKETMAVYVDILKRNTVRISDLIDGLLNSTKSSQLKLSPFPPRDAIAETLEVCNDRLKLKSVELTVVPCSEDLQIMGDLEKVKIILTNIITNAIEAMETTESPALSIECKSINQFTEIAITDNGKGMDEATKTKLFDPFFTGRHGGMGLGLSAVKHLINQHNGSIMVESAPGEGTTFCIRFPAN